MAKDSVGRTFLVAFLVCFVCSLMVSGTAAGLRAKQERDALGIMYRNVLSAVDLPKPGEDVFEVWQARVEARLVDLQSGEYTDAFDPETFDKARAARDANLRYNIPSDLDAAGLRTRSRLAPVFWVHENGEPRYLVLPVRGQGLWATMYGYLALEADLTTVAGLTIYDHGETPGLGGEIENPRWQANWSGKQAFDDDRTPRIEVARGRVDPDSPQARFQVDGISGATATARGVTNMVRYWLGEDGFGPYIERLRAEGLDG
ncbi:Na(+)-translocating NADH-quinone reductase subunit C [Geoalkalibacter halelectricus]|uniref:Na(+)-translocating NADH-quinone reductase subunit C n=1 Tax=Geoalkalibacter halelectricus TaxID=2847045 RepID=A0ABY5ZLF4_9BACT|nr:Na(+)-translocating NADH-quinone reductase subunit C [Geoalkalibacter halelectricus]MDO3378699.1 Na(+)-translocating NADH-quinone reductase subunit C [Geoalkalibacter halelectricus]UWZ79992.1 Na(+)-translocating NADH-quinone reductase subunit C [Geoalkalibacter halelectricus]